MRPYLIPADYMRDNPFAERHVYKIYHDGSHPVATRVVRSKGKLSPKRPANTAMDIAFDSLYFQAKRKSLSGDEMVDYIQAGVEKLYPVSSTLRKYILEKIDKKQRNMWKRIKRFKRKANMNRWNYFVLQVGCGIMMWEMVLIQGLGKLYAQENGWKNWAQQNIG